MQGPPPVGPELERLLYSWLTLTSSQQPGQSNPLRFPFLKWAAHGRAKSIQQYLSKCEDPRAALVIAEMDRIADFPFPPKNERARANAMEIWAWLKMELRGKVE